jgi:putative membrane protein
MMHWMDWPDWTSGWGGGRMTWHMTAHLLWYAFVIALAIVITVIIVKRIASPAGRTSALDVLKTRYARGEIGKDEFDRMRQDILA